MTTTCPTDSIFAKADQKLPTKKERVKCVTFDSSPEAMSNVQVNNAEALASRSSPALIKDEITDSKTHSPNATAPSITGIVPKSRYAL
jgi:hypothetical protein